MKTLKKLFLFRKMAGLFHFTTGVVILFIWTTISWLVVVKKEVCQYNEQEAKSSSVCWKGIVETGIPMTMIIVTTGTLLYIVWSKVYYFQSQRLKKSCDMSLYFIDEKFCHLSNANRSIFLNSEIQNIMDSSMLEVKKLLKEASICITGVTAPHENLLLEEIPTYMFHTNMEDFMFGVSRREINSVFRSSFPPLHFEALKVIIRDVLEAVSFLHGRHVYHLDLRPKNILIVNDPTRRSGFKAKVGGLELAKHSCDSVISLDRIEMEKYWRSPECFSAEGSGLVRGDKFDCWCVGIVAYELFTGGMLTVEFSRYPNRKSLPELDAVSFVMRSRYFVSSMDSRWNMKRHLVNSEPGTARFWDLTCRQFYDFGKRYYDFVQGLLRYDPAKRSTMEVALRSHLMKTLTHRRVTYREIFWA